MEDIEDLGLYLKSVREEHKVPIAKIAQELKARVEFVQAIESNDFDKLPAPTYVKGYLRSYAKYLDLDPDQILAAYNKLYPKKSEQILVLEGKKIPHIGIQINKRKLILWISAGVVVILIATLGITLILRSPKPKVEPKKEIKPAPVVETPIPEKKELTTPIATPMALAAKTQDTVWLRVYSDNKLIFEGILSKGEEKKWQAESEFKLRIGNPAKLSLTLNGQGLGQVAPYGPVNIVIDKDGVKVEK